MIQYRIYFNYTTQEHMSYSIRDAVQRLFNFLNQRIDAYIGRNPTCQAPKVKTWNINKEYADCTQAHAEYLLGKNGSVDLIIEPPKESPHTASAVLIQQPKTEQKPVAVPSDVDNVLIKIETTDEKKAKWEPLEIDPVAILQATENRLFAYKLFYYIKQKGVSVSYLEEAIGATPGTIIKFIDALDPLRPTKVIVDKLAKTLQVEPNSLWVDLIAYYLDQSKSWNLYSSNSQ